MVKGTKLIFIFIDGTLDEVKECIDEWLKEKPNFTKQNILLHRPTRNTKPLIFYILKHSRFDILEYIKYRDVDNFLYELGRHIGGKKERFIEWFDKYEKSSWNLKPLQKKKLMSAIVNRTAQIYDKETIKYIIEKHPKTKPEYINIFKTRKSELGIGMYKYLKRFDMLDNILS